MDESFDQAPHGVFAVGGLMGRGVATFELERRWQTLLDRRDINIAYFKASECQTGRGEFRKFVADPMKITPKERGKLDSISHEFLQAIAAPQFDRSYLVVSGVGVVQEDFYEVTNNPKARAILGKDPYRLAYDFAMVQSAWAMKQLGTGDTVSFVCDEHEQHGRLAPEAYRQLKNNNPSAARFMGTYSSADDKDCLPLQAADAAIYEIRQSLNLALGYRRGHLRKQFGILANAGGMFLITHSNKAQLKHIVENHAPGEPFKLGALMEYPPPHDDIRLEL